MSTENNLLESFTHDLTTLADQPVVIHCNALDAWCIASHVQLALRHPENHGPSAVVAADLCRQLFTHIATTPALEEVARRGWDPKHEQ